MNHNKGTILINEIGQILESCNMRWWLTDGTLLGLYRDGELIEYDEDIDLGCFIEDYKSNLMENFTNNGWVELHRFGNEKIGLEIALSKNNIKVDIFFYYKSHNYYWHGTWQEVYSRGKLIGRNMIKYIYSPFTLKKSLFGKFQAMTPHPTEKYILEKYGKNWKIPYKSWNWRIDPINSSKTNYIFYDNSEIIYELDLKNVSLGNDIKSINEENYIKAIYNGRLLMAKGDKKRARNNFLKALKAYPLRLTTFGFYFSTLLPNFIYHSIQRMWIFIQKRIKINI